METIPQRGVTGFPQWLHFIAIRIGRICAQYENQEIDIGTGCVWLWHVSRVDRWCRHSS